MTSPIKVCPVCGQFDGDPAFDGKCDAKCRDKAIAREADRRWKDAERKKGEVALVARGYDLAKFRIEFERANTYEARRGRRVKVVEVCGAMRVPQIHGESGEAAVDAFDEWYKRREKNIADRAAESKERESEIERRRCARIRMVAGFGVSADGLRKIAAFLNDEWGAGGADLRDAADLKDREAKNYADALAPRKERAAEDEEARKAGAVDDLAAGRPPIGS